MLAEFEGNAQSASAENKPTTQFEITKELLESFLYGKTLAQPVNFHEKGKRKWEGVDDESRRKLQSLWCEECCKHIQGDCPIHQSTAQPKLSYAIGSFPPEVRLCTSTIPEHIYGACAAKLMPRGTWIGPYEGRRVHLTRMRYDKDNTYVWEVYENGELSHFVDGSDENTSSWMRFIRCARHKKEQNMSVIQYGKNIYYYAIRDIAIGEEMLVWYHESYYQFWGVPLMLLEELNGKNGPTVPPGIQQPSQVELLHGSSQKSEKAIKLPERPQQHDVQKTFQFPRKSPVSNGYSPSSRLPDPRVSSEILTKPKSPTYVVAQHSPTGALQYANLSKQYPVLYPPITNSGTPYPPTSITTQHTPYPCSPQTRYPPTHPVTILCQPTSAQYQLKPSQMSQSTVAPNVQVLPESRTSSSTKPPNPSAPHRAPIRQQKLVAVQKIPQFPLGPHMVDSPSHCGLQMSTETLQLGLPGVEQQSIVDISRGQRVSAHYKIDNNSPIPDASSTSLDGDQWAKGEVKENMPLGGTRNNAANGSEMNVAKLPQALKATPLQNLTPAIHNKQHMTSMTERQHNKASSTVTTVKDHEASWMCGQCGEIFTQQITLRTHVCSKAPERPFHCGHCTNKFSTSSELREHVITHSNDRPFKCGFCGRSFAGATTLGNHMRTHTGQRPYECKTCGQTFAIATQLSRHLRPPGECGLGQKESSSYSQSVDIAVEQ